MRLKLLSDAEIAAFLQERDYDVRKSGNARWIDQKCAADVVFIVSDCISQYVEENGPGWFTSLDIWHDKYTVENVESFFKKPNPNEKRARNEYDKFFQQPMELLAYAGVLEKRKQGGRNYYQVAREDLLLYIALREQSALNFLCAYIEKVLADSGLFPVFQEFFDRQTKAAYERVKAAFSRFTRDYTRINGETECFRIFIKVLNPLAYRRNARGTEKGRISKHKITHDMLVYNRDNFRDLYSDKPKDQTRRQYAGQMGISLESTYSSYQSQKAKRLLRMFNDAYRDSRTELPQARHMEDEAINMHHIFPEADYPEICMYLENLIALTPTQHFSYAHPLGNTRLVDPGYQKECLLAKARRIRENLQDAGQRAIYEFSRFLYVLSVGLENDAFLQLPDLDFDSVERLIQQSFD